MGCQCFRYNLYTQMTFAHKEDNYDPKELWIQSNWEPSPANVLIEFRARVSHFLKRLPEQFCRRQLPPNLSTFQASLLAKLLDLDDFQVLLSDKNLGPCIIHRPKYITRTLPHLSNATAYLQLSANDTERKIDTAMTLIKSFLFIHSFHSLLCNQLPRPNLPSALPQHSR
jgi:hypothetical protein